MRSMYLGAAFLTIGATTASVGAATQLKGSDTLELFTDTVLANPACSGVSNIDYIGGGSSGGQNALLAGTQSVAPMSRFLNGGAIDCSAANQEAEGIIVGLDGIIIGANKAEGAACGNEIASTGKSIGSYTFTSWRDVLSIVYTGRDHNFGTADCNSQLRKDIVNTWGNLFKGGCSGGTCTQLSHAWRRSDLSGTTDTFLGLVTVNPATGSGELKIPPRTGTPARSPFCNALPAVGLAGDSDFQDNDPIRRDCTNDEQVCGTPLFDAAGALVRNTKTLGVVQVIFVPESSSNAENYPTQACTFGECRFLPTGATILTCPNGKSQLFGKCFGPVRGSGTDVSASCINPPNFTCFGATAGQDGRAYNAAVRKVDGTYVKDSLGRAVSGGFFRIRTTQQTISPTGVMTLGASLCKEDDATRQIGCLPQHDKCSIGFAGREAESATLRPDIKSLLIDGVSATEDAIRASTYPLSRKLYFNTIKGFGALVGEEAALATCMANKTIVDAAIVSSGFVTAPGATLKCQDANCAVAGTGCGNNVAPFPKDK